MFLQRSLVIVAAALTAIGGLVWYATRRRHSRHKTKEVSNMASSSEHSAEDMADAPTRHSTEKNKLHCDKSTTTLRRRPTEGHRPTANKKRQGMVMDDDSLCRDENSNDINYEQVAKDLCAKVLSQSIKTLTEEVGGSHGGRLFMCDADAAECFAVGSACDEEKSSVTDATAATADMGATQDKQDACQSETEEITSSCDGEAQEEKGPSDDKVGCDEEENSDGSAVVNECGCHSQSENEDIRRDDVEVTCDINNILNAEHTENATHESGGDASDEIDSIDKVDNEMDNGASVMDSGICELKESSSFLEIETNNDVIDGESNSKTLDDCSTPSSETMKEATTDIDFIEPCVEIASSRECNSVEREVSLEETSAERKGVEPSSEAGDSAVLKTKLTEEKQRRRSAEEWMDIFECELVAHIRARVQAEQKCAEMKNKYQRLLRKYRGLRAGKEGWEEEEEEQHEMHSMNSDDESGINDCHRREKAFTSLGALKQHWGKEKKKKDVCLLSRDEEPLDELLNENEVRRQPVRVKIQETPPASPNPPRTSTPVSQRSPRTSEQSELSAVLDGSTEDSISNVSKTRQVWETLFTSGVKASPSTSPLLSRKADNEECASMNGSILSAKDLWEEKVFHGSSSNLRLQENGSMISDDPDVLREINETSTTEAVLADSISNINETRALWETKLAQEEEEAAAMRVQHPASQRSSNILRLQNQRLSASERSEEESHA